MTDPTEGHQIVYGVGSAQGQVAQMSALQPASGGIPDFRESGLGVVDRCKPAATEAKRLAPSNPMRRETWKYRGISLLPVLHHLRQPRHVASPT